MRCLPRFYRVVRDKVHLRWRFGESHLPGGGPVQKTGLRCWRDGTPGALRGDDYPLEYYEDGYPKLPACLDRRANMKPLRGRWRPRLDGGGAWVFRAINGSDGAYVALAQRQTYLELRATEGRARCLTLDNRRSRRSRRDTRSIAGAKSIVTNSLSGGITKTSRKRRRLAGRNLTSVDASLHPRRLIPVTV